MSFPKIVLESRYGSKPGKKWTLAVNYTVIVQYDGPGIEMAISGMQKDVEWNPIIKS